MLISISKIVESETSDKYLDSEKTKRKFIDNRIVAALDALKLSDYQAMHIIAAVAISLGHDLSELVLSRASIQRARQKYRKASATKIRSDFQVIITQMSFFRSIFDSICI